MTPPQPHDPGPGPAGLYDARRLAERLGVSTARLRQARAKAEPWLPAPAGELNGGAVWHATDLAQVEQRRTDDLRPGRRTDLERARAEAEHASEPLPSAE